jgi:hypothetical protein
MSKAYGTSNKSTGRSKGIDSHPGSDPKGASDQPFSAMKLVDTKEHHQKTINNMAATPGKQAAQGLSDKHAYARQSHSAKPAGPIQSFVGSRVDGSPAQMPTVKKPGVGGTGYYPKDKKG